MGRTRDEGVEHPAANGDPVGQDGEHVHEGVEAEGVAHAAPEGACLRALGVLHARPQAHDILEGKDGDGDPLDGLKDGVVAGAEALTPRANAAGTHHTEERA